MFWRLTLLRDPANPIAPRIQQHIERLVRSRAEIFDEANRKRPFVQPLAADYNDAKRPRMDGAPTAQVQHMVPGPQSLAAVYTLTNNPGLQAFDATQVPAALAAKINVRTLAMMNPQILEQALNVRTLCIPKE